MLRIYNTLTREKEEFQPREDKKVRMFVCGPTVYDDAHIGHAKTYISFDTIAKYLRFYNYDVLFVENITDIEDRIIQRAKEQHQSPKALARFYEKRFYQDMAALYINSINQYVRATEHIPEIIQQVQTLLNKDYAYPSNDGIYFDTAKFKNYGKLSGRTALAAEDAVSRIDESIHKRNKADFALWKFSKKGEPAWKFATGEYLGVINNDSAYAPSSPKSLRRPSEVLAGRPGWHIEDTAITEKYLGQQYDIHCGARDLVFPHHEAEIAQQESASGKIPFVKYWLHTGFLTVGGRKMSKSLGNFITIRDALKKNSPEALRLLMLNTHYRSPIDYAQAAMIQAQANVNQFLELQQKLLLVIESRSIADNKEIMPSLIARQQFIEAMNDDFNTAQALAVLFQFAHRLNELFDEHGLNPAAAQNALNFWNEVNAIFNIIPPPVTVPEDIKNLSQERENLRTSGDFVRADELRRKISEKKYRLQDTPYGPLILPSRP